MWNYITNNSPAILVSVIVGCFISPAIVAGIKQLIGRYIIKSDYYGKWTDTIPPANGDTEKLDRLKLYCHKTKKLANNTSSEFTGKIVRESPPAKRDHAWNCKGVFYNNTMSMVFWPKKLIRGAHSFGVAYLVEDTTTPLKYTGKYAKFDRHNIQVVEVPITCEKN